MADRIGLEIEGGGFEFFEKMPRHFQNIVVNVLEEVGAFLSERAQQNMPIDSGDLRASTKHQVVAGRDEVTVTLQATENYALRMHEELTPAGPLQLGPGSRDAASGNIPEGGPGGRYFSRVVEFHLTKVRDHLGRQLEKNMPFALSGKITIGKLKT